MSIDRLLYVNFLTDRDINLSNCKGMDGFLESLDAFSILENDRGGAISKANKLKAKLDVAKESKLQLESQHLLRRHDPVYQTEIGRLERRVMSLTSKSLHWESRGEELDFLFNQALSALKESSVIFARTKNHLRLIETYLKKDEYLNVHLAPGADVDDLLQFADRKKLILIP